MMFVNPTPMIVVDGDAMAKSADAFRRIAQACVALNVELVC